MTENISGLPDFWVEKWGLKGCNPGANSEFIPDCPPRWKKTSSLCLLWKYPLNIFCRRLPAFPPIQHTIENRLCKKTFCLLFCIGSSPSCRILLPILKYRSWRIVAVRLTPRHILTFARHKCEKRLWPVRHMCCAHHCHICVLNWKLMTLS